MKPNWEHDVLSHVPGRAEAGWAAGAVGSVPRRWVPSRFLSNSAPLSMVKASSCSRLTSLSLFIRRIGVTSGLSPGGTRRALLVPHPLAPEKYFLG